MKSEAFSFVSSQRLTSLHFRFVFLFTLRTSHFILLPYYICKYKEPHRQICHARHLDSVSQSAFILVISNHPYGNLPLADGFKIVSQYSGPSVDHWFEANEKERKEEFATELEEIGKTEKFTYILYEFLYNHGEGRIRKFKNGEWIDLEDQFTTDIIDKDFGIEWWCWNLDLGVEFDFDKYPDIVNSLHQCVRNTIPKDQVKYCEDAWEEGEVGIFVNSISWYPRKLRVVQDFLNEINYILKPIINECDGSGSEGKWYIKEAPFAIATCVWTNNRFIIKGTQI